MKRFLFQTSVENAEGSQTWYVDAKNETEALQKYSNGDCDIYASEVDVTSIGQPELAGETTLDDFGDFRPTQPKEHLPNMSEINRTIAYSAAATLHELGYAWKDDEWIAQQKKPEQSLQVTDEENEQFSRDVSNFKGADPEATKYALETFLRNRALAQPEQKPVSWKLVPVQPTEEMLKAMDECSTEGYDERLYAGHAASVYMAAVDVAPALPQQCYCGDITRLGVVHRADSFCDEKPEQEPCLSPCGDIKCAAICKRHAEQPEQNADRFCDNNCVWTDHHPDCVRSNKPEPVGFVVDLYNGANTPSLPPTAMVAWLNDNPKIGQILYTTLPQRKPLTDERIDYIYAQLVAGQLESIEEQEDDPIRIFARAIEAAHGIKE